MEHYAQALIALEIRRQLGARDQRDLETARQISLHSLRDSRSNSTLYLTPYVKVAVRGITACSRITHFIGPLRRAFATVEEGVIWYTELGNQPYILTEADVAVYHLLMEELSEFCAIFAALRSRGSPPADAHYQTAVRLMGMLRGVDPPAPDIWERTPTAAEDGLDDHE
jgi:hypothetical protein